MDAVRIIMDMVWRRMTGDITMEQCEKMIAPLRDVETVVHGRWETDGMMMDDGEYLMTRCTACGEAYEYGYNMPFCPNCGARMDGKESNG